MNHKVTLLSILILMALLVTSGGSAQALEPGGPNQPDAALGTAITYQGKLSDGGTPASGSYDFQFILYNASAGGSQVGGPALKEDVLVSAGLFTVQLDFGAGVFGAEARWLEVGVRPGASTGDYTALSPRQSITSAPSAQYAPSAGSVPWSGVTGAPSLQTRVTGTCAAGSSIRVINSDGTVVCEADDNPTYTAGTGLVLSGTQFNLSATYSLPQGCGAEQVPQWTGSAWSCHSVWSLTGTAGTNPATNYLGTSDNQPLELGVNGQRVLRLEPASTGSYFIPNIIGGYSGNWLTPGVYGATISGGGLSGYENRVTEYYGTVGGGYNNQAGNNDGNLNSGAAATVSGGSANTASGNYSTVPGGASNTAAGSYSLAAGYMASTTAAASGTFVWADGTGAALSSNIANEFRVRAANGMRVYTNNAVDGLYVDNAATVTNADGIHVEANVSLGSTLGAIYANNIGTSPGIVAKTGSSGTYAGVFNKMISVSGGCTGCTLIYVAQNTGGEPLEMGDVTSAVGVGAPLNGSDAPVILVQRASGVDAAGVVGVVLSKVALHPSGQDGQIIMIGAEAAEGPAAPGEYVFIVVQGVAYVKGDAGGGPIVAGQRLTASSKAGQGRALQTRTLEGMTVTEAGPIIGIALAPLDTGQGLIPVMVTLR